MRKAAMSSSVELTVRCSVDPIAFSVALSFRPSSLANFYNVEANEKDFTTALIRFAASASLDDANDFAIKSDSVDC